MRVSRPLDSLLKFFGLRRQPRTNIKFDRLRRRLYVEELERRDNPAGPSIGGVVFDNSVPTTNVTLQAQVQNPVNVFAYQYLWTVNNSVVRDTTTSSGTDTLDLSQSGNGDKNDNLAVSVTPIAWNHTSGGGFYVNGEAKSTHATVANSAPTLTSTTIDNFPPATDGTFTGQFAASDADGDAVTFDYAWIVNNQTISEDTTTDTSVAYDLSNPGFGDAGDAVQFLLTLSDGTDSTTPVDLAATVPNGAPTAIDMEYSIPHNQTLDVQTTDGLLESATDADFDWLTAVIVSQAAHGIATLDSDGGFTYTAYAGFVGTDSITYQAYDGVAFSNVATVTIHVTNTTPIGADDRYHVEPETTLTVAADWGALANDTDEDDQLTAVLVTGPLYGSATLNADGSFSYTPGGEFTGADSLTYNAVDGVNVVAQATIYFTSDVAARDDVYQVDHGQTLEVSWDFGVLANDDILSVNTTVTIITGPAHGYATVNSDGSFTYISTTGYVGSDEFTYEIDDGASPFNTATVKIDVYNIAPVGADDAYAVDQNGTLTISAANGVLANDFDQEADQLTATLVQGPLHGVIDFHNDGSFTYTPTPGYQGTDLVSYRLNDGGQVQFMPWWLTFTIGQPGPAPQVTLSGTIRCVDGTISNPVRFAVVTLQANINNSWRFIQTTSTNQLGQYSFTVAPITTATRIVVEARNPTTAFGANKLAHVDVSGGEVAKFVFQRASLQFNIPNVNIDIGTDRLNKKAFWTFDAAVTANRAFGSITGSGVRASNTAYVYHRFGSQVWSGGTVRLNNNDWRNWETICHETGHIVQIAFDFLPFTLATFHQDEVNNRVQHPPPCLRLVANKLTFRESFADFFSMFAQESDNTAPQFEFDNNAGSFSKDMKYFSMTLEDDSVGSSFGEDEELTVMRILWDLFDNANSAGDLGLDSINLGFQGLFDLITNRNLPAVVGAKVALTLSDLWDNLIVRNPPAGNAANRQKMLDFGDVFQLNNVAPWTHGGGMFVSGGPRNQWSIAADPLPDFSFRIPQGMPNQPSVANLLNQFSIIFYNADYTVCINIIEITDDLVREPDNWVWWTPTNAQWNTITAVQGIKHWTIVGALETNEGALAFPSFTYRTGDYWSGANDIEIVA